MLHPQDKTYTPRVINVCKHLQKLDGLPVIREAEECKEEDAEVSDEGSDLDEDEYNDPENQEIIKTLLI